MSGARYPVYVEDEAVQFALRLPAELRAALREMAKEEGISMNKMVNSILRSAHVRFWKSSGQQGPIVYSTRTLPPAPW
jgi:hypothetical protein